jgi:large subunit ribosomal protein L22
MDQVREFRACHRFARISARKARYVMDLVRGLPVERALSDLRFSTKRATPMISKVIHSALANATQEAGLEPGNLYVAQALVDVGPSIRRWKARAMGRPRPRKRRTCHLSVILREGTGLVVAKVKKTASRAGKPDQKKSETAEKAAAGKPAPKPPRSGKGGGESRKKGDS